MISLEINRTQLAALVEAAHKAKKNFRKELSGALNQVAKTTRLNMGRDIRSVVAMKKAASERTIKIKAVATETSLVAHVSLGKDEREGLQRFGARQDKRGVSYKISKKGGRKRVMGAFMGPRPGVLAPKLYGGVFKRPGSMRLPIVKLYGISAWGAYVNNNFPELEVAFISKNLAKQMERRINLNVLRASGLVKA